MNDLLFTPIRLNELEVLIENSVQRAIKNYSPKSNDLGPVESPLNIKEVAKLTELSVPTLYGYVQRNEIPYYKKGNRLKFFKSEIIDWIRTGKQKTLKELEADADTYMANKNKGV